MMTYDGRYRLGCEGVLYVLIEPFEPKDDFLKAFENTLETRDNFEIISVYKKEEGEDGNMGTLFNFSGSDFPLGHLLTGRKAIPSLRRPKYPAFNC